MRRVACALVSLLLAGCAPKAPEATQAPPRIVSLAPSLTEIAYAIGAGGELVGDTAYDDYPAAARALPHVADLIHADAERIAALRPTIIIALHDQEREGAEISNKLAVPVRYLPNRTLNDLYADIAGVGAASGHEREASALQRALRVKMEALAGKVQSRSRPRVLFLLGLPGFTAGKGTFIDDLIRLAGGQNVAGNIDQPYPNLSAEAILAFNPQVLIVARDTPFGPQMRRQPPWKDIEAVRAGRVLRPPTDAILERNGPRIVEGLAWLVRALM